MQWNAATKPETVASFKVRRPVSCEYVLKDPRKAQYNFYGFMLDVRNFSELFFFVNINFFFFLIFNFFFFLFFFFLFGLFLYSIFIFSSIFSFPSAIFSIPFSLFVSFVLPCAVILLDLQDLALHPAAATIS